VLCLPADLVGDALMQSIVRMWLNTEFEGGRHARRVEKILAYERKQGGQATDGKLSGQQPTARDDRPAAPPVQAV
jgi:hypothetical protein